MKEIKNPPLPKLTLTEARKTALKKYKNQRDRLSRAVRKTGSSLTPSIPTTSKLASVSTNNIKKLTRQLSTFTAQDARELFSAGKVSSGISISLDKRNVKISRTPAELTTNKKQKKANKKPSKAHSRVPKHDNPKIPVKQIIEEERERIIKSWREQGIPEEEITRRLVETSIPEPKDPNPKIPVKKIIEEEADRIAKEHKKQADYEENQRIEFERSRREQDEQEKNDLMNSEEKQEDFSEGEIVYQTILSYIENAIYKARASYLHKMLEEEIHNYGFRTVMQNIESAPEEMIECGYKLCFSSETQDEADAQLMAVAEIITGEIIPDDINRALTDEREEQEEFESDNPFTSE